MSAHAGQLPGRGMKGELEHGEEAIMRRPEYGPGWYRLAEHGKRPRDPDAAIGLYTRHIRKIYPKGFVNFPEDVVRAHVEEPEISEPVKHRLKYRALHDLRRKRWITFATICAGCGVALGIIEGETLWENSNDPTWDTEFLKWCILLTTVLAVAGITEWARTEVELKRAKGHFFPAHESFQGRLARAGLQKEYLGLAVAVMVQPVPGWMSVVTISEHKHDQHTTYTTDSCLTVLMVLFRVPLLFKWLVINDPLHDALHEVYARAAGVHVGARLILATRLKEDARYLFGVWTLSIFGMAYFLMCAERPADEDTGLGEFHNCLWLTIITMTSVGYGDRYPISTVGGFLSVMACFLATILLAITVNLVVGRLSISNRERRAVALTKHVRGHVHVRQQAASAIQRLYRLSPIFRRLRPKGPARWSEAARADLQATWKRLDADDTGHGPLVDPTFALILRRFRTARLEQEHYSKRIMGSQGQMEEVVSRTKDLEMQVQQVLDRAESCLQRFSARAE